MIQQALNHSGVEVGTPDGIWGDRTVSALRDFQRARGIEPTGEPNVYTLAELGLLPGKRLTARTR
jgi:N-acetylmuramoyl-L-alanine amidase